MNRYQRGMSLVAVGVFAVVFSLCAMAALFSWRYERNVFAEAWAKVAGGPAATAVADRAREAVGATPPTTAMRRCQVNGKTVISNTECSDKNPSTKDIAIHDTKGFEAPRVPAKPEQAPTSNPAVDKMIEKQLH